MQSGTRLCFRIRGRGCCMHPQQGHMSASYELAQTANTHNAACTIYLHDVVLLRFPPNQPCLGPAKSAPEALQGLGFIWPMGHPCYVHHALANPNCPSSQVDPTLAACPVALISGFVLHAALTAYSRLCIIRSCNVWWCMQHQ